MYELRRRCALEGCQLEVPQRSGRGRPRSYCSPEHAAEARKLRQREEWRTKHPGWGARRQAANELQRKRRLQQWDAKLRAALAKADLLHDGSIAAVPNGNAGRTDTRTQRMAEELDEMSRTPELMAAFAPHIVGREREIAVALDRAEQMPLWRSLLRPDVLARWAYTPDTQLTDGNRLAPYVAPDGRPISRGLFEIIATSGDALQAIAGPGNPIQPEHAETLVSYLAGVITDEARRKAAPALAKLEAQEVRDANGRAIRACFTTAAGGSLQDAIVNLCRQEAKAA